MGLIDDIRADIQDILTNGDGFAVPIAFTTPATISPTVTVTCNGLAIKHSLGPMDEYGTRVIARTARVTISEAALVALEYPVRNGNNKVALKDHIVSFVDSAGLTYSAVITETIPDETTGNIVCMLGDKV